VNPIILLIVLVGIITSITSKKRKEEMKKKAEQRPGYPPQHSPYAPSKSTTANRQQKTVSPAAPNKKPTPGVDSKWPWPTAAQKAQGKTKPAASGNYSGTPRYTHVVTSTLEGGHTHTESSMTGEESCPPPKPVPQKPAAVTTTPEANSGALLNLQTNSVLQGVLYAEILGKPKALQRK
jgi:hypothetical protein